MPRLDRPSTSQGEQCFSLGPLASRSSHMARTFAILGRICSSQSPIHLAGEAGVGKHTLGLAIHAESGRQNLACVSCTGLSGGAELRHMLVGEGSAARPGAGSALFLAKKGTLLLHDIGRLDQDSQAVLVSCLPADVSISRGGRAKVMPVPRVLSTSSQDLEGLVRQGRFRADLYYRLGVVVDVPPLRKRPEDILDLARSFLGQGSPEGKGFTFDAGELLVGYSWPGNVRQLKSVVEAAAAHSPGEITHAALGQFLLRHVSAPAVEIPLGTSLRDAERQVIRATLAAHEGNRQSAADALGISRRTLYQKLCEYRAQAPEADFPRSRRRKGSPRAYVKKNGGPRDVVPLATL